MFRFIAVQGHDVGLLSERPRGSVYITFETALVIGLTHGLPHEASWFHEYMSNQWGDAMKRSMEPRL